MHFMKGIKTWYCFCFVCEICRNGAAHCSLHRNLISAKKMCMNWGRSGSNSCLV